MTTEQAVALVSEMTPDDSADILEELEEETGLVLDEDNITHWATERQLSYSTYTDLAKNPEVANPFGGDFDYAAAFNELDLPAVIGLGLIVAGVVVVNLFSNSVTH